MAGYISCFEKSYRLRIIYWSLLSFSINILISIFAIVVFLSRFLSVVGTAGVFSTTIIAAASFSLQQILLLYFLHLQQYFILTKASILFFSLTMTVLSRQLSYMPAFCVEAETGNFPLLLYFFHTMYAVVIGLSLGVFTPAKNVNELEIQVDKPNLFSLMIRPFRFEFFPSIQKSVTSVFPQILLSSYNFGDLPEGRLHRSSPTPIQYGLILAMVFLSVYLGAISLHYFYLIVYYPMNLSLMEEMDLKKRRKDKHGQQQGSINNLNKVSREVDRFSQKANYDTNTTYLYQFLEVPSNYLNFSISRDSKSGSSMTSSNRSSNLPKLFQRAPLTGSCWDQWIDNFLLLQQTSALCTQIIRFPSRLTKLPEIPWIQTALLHALQSPDATDTSLNSHETVSQLQYPYTTNKKSPITDAPPTRPIYDYPSSLTSWLTLGTLSSARVTISSLGFAFALADFKRVAVTPGSKRTALFRSGRLSPVLASLCVYLQSMTCQVRLMNTQCICEL